jgi:hypothetical protein
MNDRPASDKDAVMRRAAIAAAMMAPLLAQRAAAQQLPAPTIHQPAIAELVVATMAEFKRLTTRPKAVLLSGYHSATDHAGGLFVWVENDTTPADDGLVVQLADGPVGRYRRLYDGPILAAWFGTIGDGIANDTEALQRFLYSVSEGKIGDWAGTYAIDEGKLIIEPPAGASPLHGAYPAPCLLGDVVFIGRGTGTGPFLQIRNPDQHGAWGQCICGGTLGNLSFIDRTRSTLTTRHGLAAQGMINWTIGSLTGHGLGGSVYCTSKRTVRIGGADNPDPYDNSANRIGSVLGIACNGVAFDGESLTEDGNRISYLGAYGEPAPGVSPRSNGIMLNAGQGTEVHACSAAGTRGWAIQYGGRQHGNRQRLWNTEISSEYGIWVAAVEQFEITGRIVIVRYHGEAWPKTVLKLGGIGSSVADGRIDLLLRIDPDVTLPMLGDIFDFSNDPNIGNVEINVRIHDEACLGLLQRGNLLQSLAQNVNPLAGITLKVGGHALLSQKNNTGVRVRLMPGTGPLPSQLFATPESRLRGNWSALGDDGRFGIVDVDQHRLLITATGRYRVHCHLCLPVGTSQGRITPQSLVRYGLMVDDGQGGHLDGIFEGACLVQDAAGVHHVTMDVATIPLRAGQSLWISLEAQGQNGPCMLASIKFLNGANIIELSLLSPD